MSSDENQARLRAGAGLPDPLLAFADALLAESQAEPARVPSEIRQFVTFFLRDDEYALPILQCREIVRVPPVTRIPEAPGHVTGVVNLRGRVVPAVDTRARLAMESAPLTGRSRLILVEVAGRPFALIVDRVARVLKVAVTDIQPAGGDSPTGSVGVARVGESVIRLLDVEKILRGDAPTKGATVRGEGA
jgi:purine-binding chemotaxis protein CheW